MLGMVTEDPIQIVETVTDAVRSLDEKYRIAIHLFFYEGYKIREIADLLEENENTIKTRLARGKKMLKDKLEADGERVVSEHE